MTLSTKTFTTLFFTLLLNAPLMAAEETKIEKDIAAIKSMTGCYQVEFNFVETFPLAKDYQPKSDRYKAKATEWVTVAEESTTHILLQHLLIAGGGVIKHWGADWSYQDPAIYNFRANATYVPEIKTATQVEGQWSQRVKQVDDGPREQCSATWVHVDGRHFWECDDLAPLPRREAVEMQRSDYNVLRRHEHEEVTATGWFQNQDNIKTILKDEIENPLVQEKGLTTYTRIDDKECQAATELWKTQSGFWKNVREVWNEFFNGHDTVHLDGKNMYLQMNDIEDDVEVGDLTKTDEIKAQVRALIKKHLK